MAYLNSKRTRALVRSCLVAAIRSRLLGTPMWVHFFLTRRCNLRCKYCFVADSTTRELTTAEVKAAIDKLYSLGIRAIAFFGGEPTLRRDFCEILSYAHDKGFFTYFTTNGTLLDETYIDNIARTGVDFVELSVDGVYECDDSAKDYTRSRKVLDWLLTARSTYGFGLKTHLVLTRTNVESAIRTIRFNHDQGIPLTVGLVFKNVYSDVPDDDSLHFTDEASKQKLLRTLDAIIALKHDGVRIIDPVSYFENMKRYVSGNTAWGCTAGKYSFSVDADGSVQLCCSSRAFGDTLQSIDRRYFKNRRDDINRRLEWCQQKCYSNCHYTTTYLIEHPLRALFMG
jgi:MoaA/NifB/PqqE/SkfB family radical SAM enzyme